ncbi:MAG: hypothetical protein AB7U35_02160 [Sphingobium sp.]
MLNVQKKLMNAVGVAALTVTIGSGDALAQRGGGGGGGGMGGTMQQGMQMPGGDLDRTRDQMRDRDTLGDHDQDRDRLRDKDKLGDQDRDRDRARLHTSQVVDDQLTSLSLLSAAERDQFRNQMRSATTAEERNRIRAEHQNTIQERARVLGVQAPGGPGMGVGAGNGAGMQARGGYMLMQMLNEQERAQFFNRLRTAQTAQELQQIRNEMHAMARERAHEMGVDVPEWYGAGSEPR